MVEYKNSKIYKIVCNTTGLVYIGSTCEPTLARRLAKHKADYTHYLKGKKHYITSYKILENNNYEIILLELYPCNTKDELHARERYYIENINDCVNKVIPTRTQKQYEHDNENAIKERKKKYYIENKGDLIKKQKQYQLNNKNKIIKYSKQYYIENKNKISEYYKQYYKKHKEELNEQKCLLNI